MLGSKEIEVAKGKREKLLESYECTKNHVGSSSSMEIVGIKRIFERSSENKKLRITGYIGDGDTKTYEIISKEKSYGDDVEIEKFEYVKGRNCCGN